MAFDNERLFAEKLANVFLQDHRIKVAEGKGNVAFCDVVKKQIWFDFNQIFPANSDQDKIFQQMMVFKGLGFHEILHLKFTPKKKRANYSFLFLHLLGQLEDGRIETLGVMLHEKLADYFTCAVDELLIKDRKVIVENKDNWLLYAYILCYGRSIYFQDKELLSMMREMIIRTYGRETAEKIEDTINAFIPENNFQKRLDLATKLHDFLNQKGILPKYDGNKPMSIFIDTTREETDKNLDVDLKELAKDFPELSKAMGEVLKELKEMTKNVKDDSDAIANAKKEKDDKIADLSKERSEIYLKVYNEKDANKRNGLRQKVDELTQKIKDTQSSSGFSPDGMTDIKDKLKDKINEKKEEQEKLVEAHKDDLTSDLKSIGHEIEEKFSDNSFVITQDMKVIAKNLEKKLLKMNNELGNGYQPKNKSGRLNVRALLNRKSQLDFRVFNRYTPDKLRLTKALVNIYLDGSGSMSDYVDVDSTKWDKAVRCMWIINEALNRDANKVMIYQFANDFQLVKEYDKPLSMPLMLGGGTYPAGAIENSIPFIERYRKANNFNFIVDIIITDGYFDNGQDTSIMKLNNLGHETILINVCDPNSSIKHKVRHELYLKTFDELVNSMTKIFVEIKKGLVARAKVV